MTNLKAVPLTAFLIQVFLEPCSPTQRPAIFRAGDTALTPGGEALLPSRVRSEPLGAAHCNKVGVSVPGRAELRAAIYQDGTSFGDPMWVNALLDGRRFQLEQIETVLGRLKTPRAGSVARQVLVADLEAALTALQPKNTLPFPCVLNVRELVLNSLPGGTDIAPPDQIARAVAQFERLRNTLLEARPALR